MTKLLIGFDLVVGLVFLLVTILCLLLLAGFSSGIASVWGVLLYWGPLFAGPLLVITGSILSLFSKRGGPAIGLVGASVLTVCVVYVLFGVLKDWDPNNDHPYTLYTMYVLGILAVGVNVSAYFVLKLMK